MITLTFLLHVVLALLWIKHWKNVRAGRSEMNPFPGGPTAITFPLVMLTGAAAIFWIVMCLTYLP